MGCRTEVSLREENTFRPENPLTLVPSNCWAQRSLFLLLICRNVTFRRLPNRSGPFFARSSTHDDYQVHAERRRRRSDGVVPAGRGTLGGDGRGRGVHMRIRYIFTLVEFRENKKTIC